MPLSALRAIIIHYATRASREIARGSARVRVLCGTRGSLNCKFKVGGGEETREDRATGGWPGSRTRRGKEKKKGRKRRRKRGGRPKTRIFAYTRASHQTPIHFFRRAFCIRATRLLSAPSSSPFSSILLSLSLPPRDVSLYGYDIRHTRLQQAGYIPSKRPLVSSLKTLFPSPPSWLPRGDKRREREFFGPREPHGFDRVAKLYTTTIDRIILINIRQLLLASVDADIEANRRRSSICDLCN